MATTEVVGYFLARLGMLCTSNMGEEEALSRIEEYTPMLCNEYSNLLFTDPECVPYVAKRCKFFPGYGELCEHLSEFRRSTLPFQPALPAPVIPDRLEPTEEEKAVVSALTREAVGILAEASDVKRNKGQDAKITPSYLNDTQRLIEAEAAVKKYAGGKPGTPEGAFLALAIMRRDAFLAKLDGCSDQAA